MGEAKKEPQRYKESPTNSGSVHPKTPNEKIGGVGKPSLHDGRQALDSMVGSFYLPHMT